MNHIYKPQYSTGYHPAMAKYLPGPQGGPQSVVIRQVIGENQTEKVLEVPVRIPPQHPAVEQIIDVLVRRPRITSVETIFNQVIVCGDLEIKALYVACLPNQPVHAVEVRGSDSPPPYRSTELTGVWTPRPGRPWNTLIMTAIRPAGPIGTNRINTVITATPATLHPHRCRAQRPGVCRLIATNLA